MYTYEGRGVLLQCIENKQTAWMYDGFHDLGPTRRENVFFHMFTVIIRQQSYDIKQSSSTGRVINSILVPIGVVLGVYIGVIW